MGLMVKEYHHVLVNNIIMIILGIDWARGTDYSVLVIYKDGKIASVAKTDKAPTS